MAKKPATKGTKRTKTRAAAPRKLSIATRRVNDAIAAVLKDLRAKKARADNGWDTHERLQILVAEHALDSAQKLLGCPPLQSLPKPKKMFPDDF
jgi:hypothetical protein